MPPSFVEARAIYGKNIALNIDKAPCLNRYGDIYLYIHNNE